jgi:hypothetical protein
VVQKAQLDQLAQLEQQELLAVVFLLIRVAVVCII